MTELQETVKSLKDRISEQEKIIQNILQTEEKSINVTERNLKVYSISYSFLIKIHTIIFYKLKHL